MKTAAFWHNLVNAFSKLIELSRSRMLKNHYFLEAQLFSSPLHSSECSDELFSPSKKLYSENQEEMTISDNCEFPLTLDPCKLPWRNLDYPINFEMENDYLPPSFLVPAQFSSIPNDPNFIENPNVQQHYPGSTFNLKKQENTSVIDGFVNLVDQVSSFYINKLKDGNESKSADFQVQNHKEDGQKETILRRIIKKMPKKQTKDLNLKGDEKLTILAKKLEFDWKNILKKFKNKDDLPKKVSQRQEKTLKRPKTSKQPFSKEEDLEIVKYHQIYKGNWDQISKFIPNRRAYLIKNRFYSHIRKNLSQLSKELKIMQTEENLNKKAHIEKDYSTDLTDSLAFSEDEANLATGVVESEYLKNKSPSEAIEILSSRISLLTNLYNQTKVELVQLQKDPHSELMTRN